MSEKMKGKLTHCVPNKYADKVREGKFKLTNNRGFKPSGLWLSLNKGWEKWCESEEFHDIEKDYTVFGVALKPGLKLWNINSKENFYDVWFRFLNKKYSYKDTRIHFILDANKKNNKGQTIWEWLKDQGYAGVLLTDKAQWETRLSTWLYGWDCACVVMFDSKDVIINYEISK